MRPSPLVAALVAAAVLPFVLTGCATPSVDAAEPPSSAPSVSPEETGVPSSEAQPVAGGERPPTAFGGDCDFAIPGTDLARALGYPIETIVARDEHWTRSVNSAGGLTCEWEGGRIDIIPRAGLGDSTFPEEYHASYFEVCEWACAWMWESESLWITGADWSVEGRTRDEVDAIGAAVGPMIAERWEASDDEPWTRDRSSWWPAFTCDEVALAVGEQLGSTLTAVEAGYHDPPSAGTTMGDAASNMSWCSLSDDAGTQFALVRTDAGVAWDVPWAGEGQPVALGVPGIEAFAKDEVGYAFSRSYELTDGVNGATAEVMTEARWSEQQIATALAAAAAAGFQ